MATSFAIVYRNQNYLSAP